GRRQVAQHPFRHQLGAAVRVDRRRRRIFRGAAVRRNAVDRGRGREHDVPDAVAGGGRQQRAAAGRVVAVVLERIRHRFRHDRVGGEVHDGVDVVLAEQALEQRGVAGVPDHQAAARDGLREAGAQVVGHHHVLARLAELADHVAADVAGTAGDQDAAFAHVRLLLQTGADSSNTTGRDAAVSVVPGGAGGKARSAIPFCGRPTLISTRHRVAAPAAVTPRGTLMCARSAFPRAARRVFLLFAAGVLLPACGGGGGGGGTADPAPGGGGGPGGGGNPSAPVTISGVARYQFPPPRVACGG